MKHCEAKVSSLQSAPTLVFLAVFYGCRAPATQATGVRSNAVSPVNPRDGAVQDHPQSPAADTARAQAMASAVAARGVHTPVIVDATIDVDGDGAADTLFHTQSPVLYGIARRRSGAWRIDLRTEQTAEQEWSTWGPVVPLTRGAAVMLVRSLRASATDPIMSQIVAVVATEPGEVPYGVHSEGYSAGATWTMRPAGAEALELQRTRDPVAGQTAPGAAEHKVIRRISPTEWRSASCWGSTVHNTVATVLNCDVAVPENTNDRPWELYGAGPPWDPGTRVTLLYRGAAPDPSPFTRNSCVRAANGSDRCTRTTVSYAGYENWCVASPFGTMNWVYLSSAATAHCSPEGLRR